MEFILKIKQKLSRITPFHSTLRNFAYKPEIYFTGQVNKIFTFNNEIKLKDTDKIKKLSILMI
jgi:hypothetical protein